MSEESSRIRGAGRLLRNETPPPAQGKALLGAIALERKLVTSSQLRRALNVLRIERKQGRKSRLGEVLVHLGNLDPRDLSRILAEQKHRRGTTSSKPELLAWVHLAMEKGLLSASQLAEAIRIQQDAVALGHRPPLEEILVELEYVKLDRLEALQESTKETRIDGSAGPLHLGDRLGEYEILAVIGRGAMGVVYKAYDSKLKRTVALKVLREDYAVPGSVHRFQREALALARLRHEGIVSLYEAGCVSGIRFVALECVEGMSLATLLEKGRPSLADGVRLVERVARALHYAHEQGVIHRDLKPANILVDEAGKPRIVDFGLARMETERIALTVSGDVLGTPAYMAPEQILAQNRRIGPATDVYALGITLYEVVTGRLPYVATSITELYEQVLHSDPIPPRKGHPRLPEDLERVILRAIEKDPAHRYPSSEEFAEDLRRWMAGEPVSARTVGAVGRMVRKVRRHPRWTAAILAAILSAAILVPFLLHRERRLQSQEIHLAETEQRFVDQLGLTARTSLEAALHARRAGDLDAMERHVGQLRGTCARAIELRPNLAEPHYHLGRIDRALMDFDSALAHQDRALRKNPAYAPSLYERIVLLSRSYRLRLEGASAEALMSLDGSSKLPRTSLRDVELQQMEERIGTDLESLQRCGGAERETAEGIWIACLQRNPDAEERLSEALRNDPRREEVYEALAGLAISQERFDQAVDWCTQGHEADRGYLPHLVRRARARLLQGFVAGEDAAARWNSALSDCGAALKLSPRASDALLTRAQLLLHLGELESASGKNPEARYVEALSQCDAARQSRTSAWARILSMFARFRWGIYRQNQGEDPTEQFDQAAQDGEAALRLEPEATIAFLIRSYVWVNWGICEQLRGGNASRQWERAVADATAVLRRNDRMPEALLSRAQASLNLASAPQDFEPAIADCDRALQLRPQCANAYLVRARARIRCATSCQDRGMESREGYRKGMDDCRDFLNLEPRSAEGRIWLATALGNLGLDDLRQGLDPFPRFQEAIQACDAAQAFQSRAVELYLARGWTRLNWGVVLHQRGKDPEEWYRNAIADADTGLGFQLRHLRLLDVRAQARMNWATYLRDRAKDTVSIPALLDAAVKDWDLLLTATPRSAEALRRRAECRVFLGDLAGADSDFRRAAELAPALVPEFRELWDYARRGN